MFRLVLLLSFVFSNFAWAIPAPVSPIKKLEIDWDEFSLRLDVTNLIGENNEGYLPNEVMLQRISEVNFIWAQCSIQFYVRSVANISATALSVPYRPQSQEDLSKIAAAINPNGFDGAIPLTFAGYWGFKDSYSGFYLHGLGWVFIDGQNKIDRVGAMIGSNKFNEEYAASLISHELGHALALDHWREADNLMAGGQKLTQKQCNDARFFAQTILADFQEKSRQEKTRIVKLDISSEGTSVLPFPRPGI